MTFSGKYFLQIIDPDNYASNKIIKYSKIYYNYLCNKYKCTFNLTHDT